MAIITDDQIDHSTLGPALAEVRPLLAPAPIPKAPEAKTTDGLLGAAFRQENLIGSILSNTGRPTEGEFDRDFSPRAQARVDGIGEHADRFNNVRNREEYDWLKSKIEREKKDSKIISDNGALGLAAAVFAGVADPVSLASFFVPGLGEARATSLGSRILGYAGRGALEAGAQEIPLNLTQETRSAAQSTTAIVGGAIVHSLLGTAADKVVKGRKDKLIADILSDGEADSIGAARVSPGGSDTASKLKTNKAMTAVDSTVTNTGFEGVGLTVAKSESAAVRRAGQELAIDILQREGTESGQAAPQSAELLIRAGRADLIEFAQKLRDARRSLDGLGQLTDADKLTIAEQLRVLGHKVNSIDDITPQVVQKHLPELIAHAARNSDTHVVSQVEGMAKTLRSIFDRDYARAIRLGLVDATETLLGAPSYFTRVFNKVKVAENQTQFLAAITPHIEQKLVAMGESVNKAEDIATSILNNIDGLGNGSATDLLIALTEKGHGKLAQRVLDIPDEVLAPFLENDASKVLSIYKRSVEPQMALKEATGFTKFDNYVNEKLIPERDIEKTKLAARTDMDDPAQVAKLNEALARYDAKWKEDIAALEQLWRRVEGRAAEVPKHEVGKNLSAGFRIARRLVSTVSLGGTVISSLPDIGLMVMTHGLAPVMKNWAARLTSKEFKQFSKDTAQRIGTAGELVLYKQAKLRRDLMANGFDPELQHIEPGRIERGVDNFAEHFQYWSGAMWWNDTPRQMAATLAEDRILRNAAKGWSALPQSERNYLAVMGIDEQALGKIKAASDPHIADISGFKTTDPGEWTDLEAARYFKLAALKDASTTINSPTAGTLPVWADAELAKFLLQFKSFIFANYQQATLVGLQRGDARAFLGLTTMTAIGMAVAHTRNVLGGRADKDEPWDKLVWEGIDRSGIASVPYELYNNADLASRAAFGHGLKPYQGARIQEPTLADVFGPTAGYGKRIFDVTKDIAKDGTLSDKGQAKAVGLLPYQNIYGVKPFLAALEWSKGNTDYIDRVVKGFQSTFPDMNFDEADLNGVSAVK